MESTYITLHLKMYDKAYTLFNRLYFHTIKIFLSDPQAMIQTRYQGCGDVGWERG